MISKDPVPWHFYWIFGGKVNKRLQKSEISQKISVQKRPGDRPNFEIKNENQSIFLLGLNYANMAASPGAFIEHYKHSLIILLY